jgi:hypothetical protein
MRLSLAPRAWGEDAGNGCKAIFGWRDGKGLNQERKIIFGGVPRRIVVARLAHLTRLSCHTDSCVLLFAGILTFSVIFTNLCNTSPSTLNDFLEVLKKLGP